MHDLTPPPPEKPKVSDEIIGVLSQLQRLSAKAKGPLNLDDQSAQHLIRDLGNIYRLSLEREKEFMILRNSHERIARISGIYKVFPQPQKRRAGFKIVGGTEAATEEQKEKK